MLDTQPPIYTQEDFERAVAETKEKKSVDWRRCADARHSSILELRNSRIKALEADNRQKARIIDYLLDDISTPVVQWRQHLDNCIGNVQDMPMMEGIEMGKGKIDRRVKINGREMRIRANSEEEYAQKLFVAMGGATVQMRPDQSKHQFNEYAQYWFDTFSKATTAQATAITYERQLTRYLYPAFEGMNVADITTADAQKLFNGMEGTKETKKKCKNVLNMVFELAIDENIIAKNPLKSRRFKITGTASNSVEPYTVEQMRFLVSHMEMVTASQDRMYLALHALHPFRPEEVWGLKWKDINFDALTIRIERAAVHPDRNQPIVKDTKTESSSRTIDLVPQIIPFLDRGAPEDFVLGGANPLSYSQVRRMCIRIQKDIGFDEKITPRRFRTTVLTDLYDQTKDIKQAQAAAGHTTAAMTLEHYVKGRAEKQNTAVPIANTYGLV